MTSLVSGEDVWMIAQIVCFAAAVGIAAEAFFEWARSYFTRRAKRKL
jgi:hypothetical protein